MKNISSLLDIAPETDAFFIDIFGVLWDGKGYFPNALPIMENLERTGKKIYILSNSTTVSEHLKEKHHTLGMKQGIHYTKIIPSADVLKDKMEKENFLDTVVGKNGKFAIIGRPNDRLFEKVLNRYTPDLDEATAVYFGSLEVIPGEDLETLDPFLPDAEKALKKGLPAICANPDHFAFRGDTKHVVQGLLGKWYEDRGGKVYWFGKPYPEIYEYTLKLSKTLPEKTVMVGDTIRTDIKGAKECGLKTVLITGTGITHDLLQNGETLDEIAVREGAFPDYLLKELK